ncbi:unnamed protein product [Polarella glacialis]|uniref:AB hydrolase-1 domain-containing protein n=1 Tax=Polarella glacialis TaxID=89957 RepID=A0A813FP13_POLGL|nr:unnamed protein product [Polarella glacialis]
MSRQDILEWISWGLFDRPTPELSISEQQELGGYVNQLAQLAQLELPNAGHEAVQLPCMKATWQPFASTEQVVHLPLLVYSAVALGDLVASLWLRWHGFQLRTTSADSGRLRYWERSAPEATVAPVINHHPVTKTIITDDTPDAASASQEPLPAVFFHGMGIGLLPYCMHFLPDLLRLQEQRELGTLLLVRQPFISMDILEASRNSHPTAEKLVTAVEEMLVPSASASASAAGRQPSALFIGHSFGTFHVAHMCRLRPKCVAGAVFLDPMCFMLHLGTTTEASVYAPLRSETSLSRRMLRGELLTNITLRRRFCWHQNCLWLEDLREAQLLATTTTTTTTATKTAATTTTTTPPTTTATSVKPGWGVGGETPGVLGGTSRALVVLGGQDTLMASVDIQNYLGKGVQLLAFPEGTHGQVVLSQDHARQVSAHIEQLAASLKTYWDLERVTMWSLPADEGGEHKGVIAATTYTYLQQSIRCASFGTFPPDLKYAS